MNTSTAFPTLFVSHGSPRILTSAQADGESISRLATQVPRPRAIVVVSAHWIDEPVSVAAAENLSTIHDFGGFEAALYQMQYPARGDAELSQQIVELIQQQGMDARLDAERGLDHGAWVPLMLMYPDAEIPVVQVSLPAGSLQQQVEMGEALKPLREQGVLVIGSGGSLHNLSAMNDTGQTDAWAIEFEEWLRQSVEENHFDHLITAENFPSNFRQAHPSIEHFVPIIVAWAAADRSRAGTRIHHSFSYGNLGMSHYLFA